MRKSELRVMLALLKDDLRRNNDHIYDLTHAIYKTLGNSDSSCRGGTILKSNVINRKIINEINQINFDVQETNIIIQKLSEIETSVKILLLEVENKKISDRITKLTGIKG